MAHDWDIKSRGESCEKCETAFQDNQSFTAALIYGAEGYERTDYCDTCWNEIQESTKTYSVWQGLFKLPPPPEEDALKKETAESLLRKLMEKEDASKINLVFILAVMLERKKILVEKDTQTNEDGKLIRIYEHKATGETFLVTDPLLLLSELEEVQEEVVVMLGGKPRPKKADPEIPEETEAADPDEDEYEEDDLFD